MAAHDVADDGVDMTLPMTVLTVMINGDGEGRGADNAVRRTAYCSIASHCFACTRVHTPCDAHSMKDVARACIPENRDIIPTLEGSEPLTTGFWDDSRG